MHNNIVIIINYIIFIATGFKNTFRAASSVPVTPFGSTDGSFEKDRIEKGPGIYNNNKIKIIKIKYYQILINR